MHRVSDTPPRCVLMRINPRIYARRSGRIDKRRWTRWKTIYVINRASTADNKAINRRNIRLSRALQRPDRILSLRSKHSSSNDDNDGLIPSSYLPTSAANRRRNARAHFKPPLKPKSPSGTSVYRARVPVAHNRFGINFSPTAAPRDPAINDWRQPTIKIKELPAN